MDGLIPKPVDLEQIVISKVKYFFDYVTELLASFTLLICGKFSIPVFKMVHHFSMVYYSLNN